MTEANILAQQFDAKNVADLATLRPVLEPARLLDIPDPIGQEFEQFTLVGGKIARALPPILQLCGRSD